MKTLALALVAVPILVAADANARGEALQEDAEAPVACAPKPAVEGK